MAFRRTTSCALASLAVVAWIGARTPAAEPIEGAAAETAVEAVEESPVGSAEEKELACATDKPFEPLSSITAGLKLDIARIPTDCSKDLFGPPRPAGAVVASMSRLHWQPSNFFHQPLYFDDTPLERYGQSLCPCVQPVISGARFFITLPAVPYKIGVDHTCDCVTTLGKYRPGACAPCMKEVLPLCDLDGALLTAGTAVVLALCLP